MQDQGNTRWFEADDLLSNALNHDTDGAKFKDWRLPTKRELNLVYTQKSNIGIAINSYWSSTEAGDEKAWEQDFDNGHQNTSGPYYGNKYESNFVRAVRAF